VQQMDISTILIITLLMLIMINVLYWWDWSCFLKLQIESLSVTFHGHDLIVDSELELNYGRFVILTLTCPHVMRCIYSSLQFLPLIVIALDFFQALWFTWIKWLWKIYTAYSHWSAGTSNSWTYGYLSPYPGDWSLWHVCIGSCHKLWWGKVEIGERSWNFGCTGLLK